MSQNTILIVEDEAIVAEDLKAMLNKLGYRVAGIAASGEEALRLTEAEKPDLILMDIRIKGKMDGIDTAEQIMVHHNIPVTYLTAYADDQTLNRAKTTLPYGYLLKPFEERDLRTTIEVALYKHRIHRLLEKMDNWHALALRSLNVGVVAVDPQEKVTFMNPMAEALTGRRLEGVLGQSLEGFFPGIKTGAPSGRAEIILPDQSRVGVSFREAPVLDEIRNVLGRVITFQKT